MHYLVLQIIGFLLAATIGGVVLGWWFKGIMTVLQRDQQQQRDQQELDSVKTQLTQLRGKYLHTQQQIEQYTEYFNGSTYSQLQDENRDLLTQIAQYQQQVQRLQTKLENNVGKIASSAIETKKQKPPVITAPAKAYYNDDLKKIKGITKEIEQQLNSLGILKYRQIAEFSLQDAEMIAKHLSKLELPDYRSMISTARNLYTELQHAA
jgi:predicted flap endonuclease-1-like 5' DNA nuclease